jgi:glucokinase
MERWGTTVVLDNDANCAARAEVTHGAARGAGDAVVVTLGTGIGGAVVLDGRVHRGSNGMAGEFGHMQVVPDGLACECGGRGCWEQYSSGNALVRLSRARMGQEPTLLDELCGGDPDALSGPLVTTAAQQGDAVALAAFQSVGDWLGVGVANLVAAFDPEVVVVGGGVSAAGELLLAPARVALARSLVGAGHRVVPPFLRAALGPEAGAIGGADLARAVVKGADRRRRLRTAGSPARARRRAARGTARRR